MSIVYCKWLEVYNWINTHLLLSARGVSVMKVIYFSPHQLKLQIKPVSARTVRLAYISGCHEGYEYELRGHVFMEPLGDERSLPREGIYFHFAHQSGYSHASKTAINLYPIWCITPCCICTCNSCEIDLQKLDARYGIFEMLWCWVSYPKMAFWIVQVYG